MGSKQGTGYVFSSGTLFAVAKRAWQNPLGREREPAPDGLIAVLFAALSVECFLNELRAQVGLIQRISPEAVLARYLEVDDLAVRLPIRDRVCLAAIALSGRPLDRGREPYQPFAQLFELRDAIVHMKPQTAALVEGEFETRHELLREGSPFSRLCTEDPRHPFLQRIATRGMVDWACRAAVGIVQEMLRLFPAGESPMFGGFRVWFTVPEE